MEVFSKGRKIGTRKIDFLVVEIKAIIRLEDVHSALAINDLDTYSRGYRLEL